MSWYIDLVKYVLLIIVAVVLIFKLWQFGKILGNRIKGIKKTKDDEFDKIVEGY